MTAFKTVRGTTALLCFTSLLASPVAADDEYAKRFPAQWLENNGHIRLDTICYNYPRQSHMYPLCRLQAVNRLDERCERYRTRLANTDDPALQEHFSGLSDKYCTASEDYRKLMTRTGFLQ